MAISPKKFQYLKEIFSPLGEINFKSYFSYLGIFKYLKTILCSPSMIIKTIDYT